MPGSHARKGSPAGMPPHLGEGRQVWLGLLGGGGSAAPLALAPARLGRRCLLGSLLMLLLHSGDLGAKGGQEAGLFSRAQPPREQGATQREPTHPRLVASCVAWPSLPPPLPTRSLAWPSLPPASHTRSRTCSVRNCVYIWERFSSASSWLNLAWSKAAWACREGGRPTGQGNRAEQGA